MRPSIDSVGGAERAGAGLRVYVGYPSVLESMCFIQFTGQEQSKRCRYKGLGRKQRAERPTCGSMQSHTARGTEHKYTEGRQERTTDAVVLETVPGHGVIRREYGD